MTHMSLVLALVAAAVVIVVLFWVKGRQGNKNTGSAASEESVSGDQVYLGNLAYKVNEGDVRALFSQYGDIKHIKIVRHPQTRRSKGFGFVTYTDEASAQKSLVVNGTEFQERAIVVKIAKARDNG